MQRNAFRHPIWKCETQVTGSRAKWKIDKTPLAKLRHSPNIKDWRPNIKCQCCSILVQPKPSSGLKAKKRVRSCDTWILSHEFRRKRKPQSIWAKAPMKQAIAGISIIMVRTVCIISQSTNRPLAFSRGPWTISLIILATYTHVSLL